MPDHGHPGRLDPQGPGQQSQQGEREQGQETDAGEAHGSILPFTYGRIDRMYLGSEFHRFWARSGRHELHPDDAAYLSHNPFTEGVLPCPFDGPLDKARVVICLANPSYAKVQDKTDLNDLIFSMRTGEEKLPELFADFYRRITGPIGMNEEKMRELVAVLNVCPYASPQMGDRMERIAAGLPSVWQAQQYLRQVLIPRAQTGNIYLVLIRKLQLWGVTSSDDLMGNMRVVAGRELGAVMSRRLGEEINSWLVQKGHMPGGAKPN